MKVIILTSIGLGLREWGLNAKTRRTQRFAEMILVNISLLIRSKTTRQMHCIICVCPGYIIDSRVMENNTWGVTDVEKSIKLILEQDNTNFQSPVKNLENNRELYTLVHELIINGEEIRFHIHNPLISPGFTYGIFQNKDGLCVVHDKVYAELIYN